MPVDVILLDLSLPGMHGVSDIPILLKHFPAARILVITIYDHKPLVPEALAVGASGYLLKSDRFKTICAESSGLIHEDRWVETIRRARNVDHIPPNPHPFFTGSASAKRLRLPSPALGEMVTKSF